jgi:putative flippase GtrA
MKLRNGIIIVFEKLFKFGIIGSVGLFIDFGITWCLKEKINLHYLVANFIGFSFAAISNFFLNSLWTFENKRAGASKKLTLFVAISLVGLLMNTVILNLLVRDFSVNFYLAKFITVVLVFSWNFTANYFITFKEVNAQRDDKIKIETCKRS